MALTVKVTPGYTYTDNEVDTAAKRNLAAKPTVDLEGTISTQAIADGSVTTPKLVDGVLSADAAGRAKMADGFLSADATGRGKLADGLVNAAKAEETFRAGVAQYSVGTFAAGVYTLTLTPAATAYTAGMRVAFKPDTVNAGGDSLNVNGLGNKALLAMGSVPVAAGQLKAGQVVSCVYDGAAFQMENGDGQFVTAELAIAVGQLVDTAHGLGIAPTQVRWVLRNKTGELGYSVGDEVAAWPAHFSSTGTEFHAFGGGASATNLFCVCASTAFSLPHKTTGTYGNATAANWKVVGYARR